MKRSRRLEKKLHKNHLIEVATDVVSDEEFEKLLWKLSHGEKLHITYSEYSGSESLKKYGLKFVVERGPIEGHWGNGEFDSSELALMFYSEAFPKVRHGWLLF